MVKVTELDRSPEVIMRTTLTRMALGKRRRRPKQTSMWVAVQDLPRSAAHPFYTRLNHILEKADFDGYVESLCQRFYADEIARPSLSPGRYFRVLLLGYFEGLDSERAIAWRAADSLSVRSFLGLELHEAPPDHSTVFETANHRRDSACAVGLATGCNGRIVASRTYTIRPPTPQFSFTWIHGVRWEDVRDAPTFGDLWPTLRGWIDNVEFLAAHNASFDRSVLLACCAEIPAACAANTVHLYRPACSRTMGNLPDDAARRLPTASYSAPSPRRRVGRGSVRAHRTRRRGRRPHEKMAIHVVTAGACGGWHPPRRCAAD